MTNFEQQLLQTLARIDSRLDRLSISVLSQSRNLSLWNTIIMSTFADLQSGLAALEAKVDADAQQSAAAVALLQALTATIDDLKSQIGAGVAVSQADLDGALAQIQGITGKLDASDATLAAGITDGTPPSGP
jgi:hypothetical protein